MKNGEPIAGSELNDTPPVRPHYLRLKRTTFAVLLAVLFFFLTSTTISIWQQYQLAWEKLEFEAQAAATRLDRWLVYPLRFFDSLPLETIASGSQNEEKFFNQIVERSHRFYGVKLTNPEGLTVKSYGSEIKSEPTDTWVNQKKGDLDFLQFGKSFYEKDAETWLMPVRHSHLIGEQKLTATVYLDGRAFETIFNTMHPDGNGSLSIFRKDGLILARIPYTENLVGKSFANGKLFQNVIPHSPNGISRPPKDTDGVERIVAHRSLTAYPLVITVGLNIQKHLDKTLQKLISQNIANAGIFLTALVFAYILWQQVKAAERAQQELLDTQEKLHRLASIDPLTSCFNRRAFMRKAEIEKARVDRHGGAFSCIMIDLDNFKTINDTHGHQIGDAVLREFVQLCEKSLRAMDFIGRYGGEEFVILLPETPIGPTLEVAERIRQEINKTGLRINENTTLPVTFSAGVTTRLKKTETIDELFRRADIALYQAKKRGRNRIQADETVLLG